MTTVVIGEGATGRDVSGRGGAHPVAPGVASVSSTGTMAPVSAARGVSGVDRKIAEVWTVGSGSDGPTSEAVTSGLPAAGRAGGVAVTSGRFERLTVKAPDFSGGYLLNGHFNMRKHASD